MGDRVAAENFLQHADHYYRVVASMNEGQRPRIGGREVSVADVNMQNVNQGLSAAMSGHGHSGGGDEQQHSSDNQQGGHGNGQAHPNQNAGESPNQQRQGSAESQGANSGDSAPGDNTGDAAGYAPPEDQPDYPEEAASADGANTGPRDGQQQDGRGRGRGRRRGPGRRVRSEGEETTAAPTTQPPSGETQ
jgi:hypothetical protein